MHMHMHMHMHMSHAHVHVQHVHAHDMCMQSCRGSSRSRAVRTGYAYWPPAYCTYLRQGQLAPRVGGVGGGAPTSGVLCRTRTVYRLTGGAKGLPSVILGVHPDGAATARVAVGERLLAVNGQPVTDHDAASQLLRAATGEVASYVETSLPEARQFRPPASPASAR